MQKESGSAKKKDYIHDPKKSILAGDCTVRYYSIGLNRHTPEKQITLREFYPQALEMIKKASDMPIYRVLRRIERALFDLVQIYFAMKEGIQNE